MNRAGLRYAQRTPDQTALRLRIRELAASRVRYGYLRLHLLLRREGWHVNHKRVYRLYKLEGLELRLKSRKKRVSQVRVVPPPAQAPQERWSMDFMTPLDAHLQAPSGQAERDSMARRIVARAFHDHGVAIDFHTVMRRIARAFSFEGGCEVERHTVSCDTRAAVRQLNY